MRAGLALVWLLSACGTGPPVAGGSPDNSLDQAETLLREGDAGGAEIVLNRLDPADLESSSRQRFELLLATTQHAQGDSWQAYKGILDFTSRYFLSDYEGQIAELTFLIGDSLIQSDRSWWIFGSDQEDGEVVLTQFISRFPTNAHVPEALMLLGETAFRGRDYEMAQERYQELRSSHPRSEWAALASFRLAISAFELLIGPAYDQTEMTQARSELRDYLDLDPERPEFRQEAERALATVSRWLAQRELSNANFYRRIGNRYGEVFHLRNTAEDYPQSRPGMQARRRLAGLGEAVVDTDPSR